MVPPRSGRARIRQAALELFGKKGIAAATVNDIAKRAGCSQAAIYKHWASKDALAHELFVEGHEALLASMEAEKGRWSQASERIIGSVLGFLHYARRQPELYALLFQVFHSEYSSWLVSYRKPSDLLSGDIALAMKTGGVAPGDAPVKAALLLGMAIRLGLFERQGIVTAGPDVADAELTAAAAGILGV